MEETKVKIVLKHNIVWSVYANNPIEIETLDLDNTLDEKELKALENEIADYENNYIRIRKIERR